MKVLRLTEGQLGYLLALVESEADFDEESRHLSEENSEEREEVMAYLRAVSEQV